METAKIFFYNYNYFLKFITDFKRYIHRTSNQVVAAIQTMFIKGIIDGRVVDNTTDEEVNALVKAYEKIKPVEVQVYTVSRDAPDGFDINKVDPDALHSIAGEVNKIGIKTQVST